MTFTIVINSTEHLSFLDDARESDAKAETKERSNQNHNNGLQEHGQIGILDLDLGNAGSQ